jgi:hypothetical protein
VHTVTFSRRLEDWVVRGETRRGGVNGELVLMRDELPHIAAVDLRMALSNNASFYEADSCDAEVSDAPEGYFDPEHGGGQVGFELADDELLVSIIHFGQWPDSGDEQDAINKVQDLVTPFLDHKRAKLHSIEVEDSWSIDMNLAMRIRLAAPWRGRNAAALLEIGEAILRLCDSFSSSAIGRDSVADLVRGGCAELLIGQEEGNWLDAKAEEYDLTTTRGKISLAQAVARFCNGEDGGLIVIGANAKKIPGGEEIRRVRGVIPRYADTVARYQRILDHHLYPPVMGLRIDLVPTTEDRSIISLDIPAQPEELKPFLVHGAVTAEGETEGSFISIVQRRGEGSVPITAPMIHATLAAGRALLRGSGGADRPHERH